MQPSVGPEAEQGQLCGRRGMGKGVEGFSCKRLNKKPLLKQEWTWCVYKYGGNWADWTMASEASRETGLGVVSGREGGQGYRGWISGAPCWHHPPLQVPLMGWGRLVCYPKAQGVRKKSSFLPCDKSNRASLIQPSNIYSTSSMFQVLRTL